MVAMQLIDSYYGMFTLSNWREVLHLQYGYEAGIYREAEKA
jgi:hypothetical protein